MKISRQVGTTNEVLAVFIRDATNVSSAGLANVSASSVNFAWCRNNQTAISSGVCTAGGSIGTYSVSTLTQLSSTSTLGWYHFSPPDVMFLSGRSAILHLYGYPNMAPTPIEVELTAGTNQSILSVSVSTMATPVGVSSASVNLGISSAPILLGVSTMSVPVGVSSASVNLGVSTLATSVSSVTGSVDVSSSVMVSSNVVQMNGATVLGDGTAGNLWRG